MDILKLLLCVMLLLLYQNCSAEMTTKNESKNIKSKDTRRANSPRTKITEEEAPKPKEINVNDKTDINIKITPKQSRPKSSNASKRLKHPKTPFITDKGINQPLDQEITKEKVMKAIHIPIDLLLKDHDKDNRTTEATATQNNKFNKAYNDVKTEPKIKETENDDPEIGDTETGSDVKISDEKEKTGATSRSGIRIIEDDSVVEDELDIRLGNECINKLINSIPQTPSKYLQHFDKRINNPDTGQINEIYPELKNENDKENATLQQYELDKEKISINYSTNNNESLKEQIDNQATKIEIMIDHVPSNANNKPYSSILIRNNSYQEVTEPLYKYPSYWYPTAYANYYTCSQSNQYTQNPQYGTVKYDNWPQYQNAYPINYNDISKRVWRTWHSMDIRINPNERFCEGFNSQNLRTGRCSQIHEGSCN